MARTTLGLFRSQNSRRVFQDRGPRSLWLLGLSLLLLFCPLLAQAGARVVVLGLHSAGSEPERVRPVSSSLEAALQQATNLSVVRDELVRRSFTEKRAEISEALILGPAKAMIQEARGLAEQAQFDKAIETFLRADAHLTYYLQHLTSQTELLEVQRSLIQLYDALGDSGATVLRMRRLVVLDPSYELDALRHSPALIERYKATRAELLGLTSSLELVSEPSGASAWLNGKPVGQTPVTLKGLPFGAYLVRLGDASGRVLVQETTLNQASLSHVGGALEAPTLYAEGRRPPSPEEAEAKMIEIYRTLGRALETDFILLGRLRSDALEVQLLRVSDGARGPLFEGPVAPDLSNLNSSVRNLVMQLDQLISPTGKLMRTSAFPLKVEPTTNPLLAQYIFGSAGLEGSSASARQTPRRASAGKPLLQQPWFWAVAGGVLLGAAGGGTAALLAAMPDPPAATITILWP